MKQSLFGAFCLACIASTSHASGEAELAKLFSAACASQYPAYSQTASVADRAGLKPQKDGTFKGGGILLNPNVKLSSRGKACLTMQHGTDPEVVAKSLPAALQASGVKVSKATRKGRRYMFVVRVGGNPAEILVAPVQRTFTSISISEP